MIDSHTRLFCVFGNPVRHSKSPDIHNVNFQHYNMNAVYLAFEIDNISKAIAAMKTLNIKGASVTIPFKESIMKFLDWIHEDAVAIGAVNTVINTDGKLLGYNTDHMAAILPLIPFGIQGKTVCIIGAGGAAQAVAYGIQKENGRLVIINRNKERGERLASKYAADFIPMEEAGRIKSVQADIIINTTSLGMSPHMDVTPFPTANLNHRMIVMDIVYTPLKTKLLYEAQNRGCKIIDGLSMFLHQGAAQFKLWTGETPDIELMRNVIMNGAE